MHRVAKEGWATKDLYGGADGDTLLIPAFTTHGGDVGKLSPELNGRLSALLPAC